jgi:hypothetical protein
VTGGTITLRSHNSLVIDPSVTSFRHLLSVCHLLSLLSPVEGKLLQIIR